MDQHQVDVHAPPDEYYSGSPALRTPGVHRSRSRNYQRTYPKYSQFGGEEEAVPGRLLPRRRSVRRRASIDEKATQPRRFLVDIDTVEKIILEQEDTN
ncbi:hypothetical protein IWW55_005372, partial [Coemansia sp. RSA 2706]